MWILLTVLGVALMAGALVGLIKVRPAPDGTPHPFAPTRTMNAVIISLCMAAILAGLMLVAVAVN